MAIDIQKFMYFQNVTVKRCKVVVEKLKEA